MVKENEYKINGLNCRALKLIQNCVTIFWSCFISLSFPCFYSSNV